MDRLQRSKSSRSCNFCKRRKVRCDKGTPCAACVKYGNPICEYAPEPVSASRARKRTNGAGALDSHVGKNRPQERNGSGPDAWRATWGSARQNWSEEDKGSAAESASHGVSRDVRESSVHIDLAFLKHKISMLERTLVESGQIGQDSQKPGNAVSSGKPGKPTNSDNSVTAVGLDNPVIPANRLHPVKLLNSDNPANPEHSITSPPIWQAGPDHPALPAHNPCLSHTQTFSFHDSYVPFIAPGTSSARHFQPLNVISLVKMLNAVPPLAMKSRRLFQEASAILTLDSDPSGPSDRVFSEKLQQIVGDECGYGEASPQSDEKKTHKLRFINQRAKIVGLTVFEGDLGAVHDIVQKANLLMPSRKVAWMLVDRFFEIVYPFFPFLDQTEFEGHVSQILGSRDRHHVKVQLQIQKKSEIIHLGTLLLVLRFSYLTLFTNHDAVNESNLRSIDPSPEAQKLRFLLENPIDTDVFGVAQICLFNFGFLRYPSIPILQLCLFLKVYNSFAPENGEGSDDSHSQGFSFRIVEMAMALGLHREPDNFRTKVRDEKTNNLCRKIWWFLVTADVVGGLTNGSPLAIRRAKFDTLPPFYRPGNENIRNTDLERQVVLSLAQFDALYDTIYDVLSVIPGVRTPLLMKDFCARLSNLERQFADIPGNIVKSLPQNTGTISEVARAYSLRTNIQIAFFLVAVYLHFFNHYDERGETDLAYFYLKKLLSVSVHRMMPFYGKFVDECGEFRQNVTNIAIAPSFQTLAHKCTFVINITQMRAKCSIAKCDISETHAKDLTNSVYRKRYELLNETYHLCEKIANVFLGSMKAMSSRYYYCWKYLRTQEKIRSIRNGPEFYDTFFKRKEHYNALSNVMLEDFNGILRESLEELESECCPNDVRTFSQYGAENSDPSQNSRTVSNDQFADAMWAQMLSMKPDMGRSGYSVTPPTSLTLDFLDAGFIPDYNFLGTGSFDALLDDLLEQGAEF